MAKDLEGEERGEEKNSPSLNEDKPEEKAGDTEQIVLADPLQLYISKVRQYPTLSPEEERKLAELYFKTGDKDAAFRLATSNLMLVVKIAFEFRTQFQNMLDLIQEGNYGLMRAIQKFNPFKGARLSTYSSYWIRAYMLKYLLDNWRLVKVGTTNMRRKLLYRLRDMERSLNMGEEPVTAKLLAEKFGATEEDVIEVQKSLGAQDKSIFQPVEEGSSRQVQDTLDSGEADFTEVLGDRDMIEKLREAVEKFKPGLRPVELTLLQERILSDSPMTLQEIGKLYGVTREAVRQSEQRLTHKLLDFVRGEFGMEDDG